MKRVITGLSAIVIAITAFAFTSKDSNYCLYEKTGATCPLLVKPYSYTIQPGIGIRFVQDKDNNGNCSQAVDVSLCNLRITYVIN